MGSNIKLLQIKFRINLSNQENTQNLLLIFIVQVMFINNKTNYRKV